MKTKVALAFTLALALSACASVPMASLEGDNQAKSFKAAPGKAAIYLYRNESFGGAVRMPVAVNGKLAGQTGPKTYFLWEVEPGAYELSSIGEDTSTLKLNAIAGKLYFIWQEMKMGLFAPRSSLQEVDETTGRSGVMESTRAASSF